jgi:hypothetical protein
MNLARRLFLPAIVGALGLAACRVEHATSGRPAAAVPDSAVTAQIDATLRLYYARATTGDLADLGRSFWRGATITSIMRTTTDTAARVRPVAIEDLVQRGRAARACPVSFAYEMVRATVETYGPLAEAWAVYRWRCGVSPDSTATSYGVDAFLLMHHDGEWRISSLALTPEVADRPLVRVP